MRQKLFGYRAMQGPAERDHNAITIYSFMPLMSIDLQPPIADRRHHQFNLYAYAYTKEWSLYP